MLKVKESITRVRHVYRKNDDGMRYSVPIYYEVKRGEKDPHKKDVWTPGAYGHEDIRVGDVIDLDGHLADKAAMNPDFEEVFEAPPIAKKKKRGRPRKVVEDAA